MEDEEKKHSICYCIDEQSEVYYQNYLKKGNETDLSTYYTERKGIIDSLPKVLKGQPIEMYECWQCKLDNKANTIHPSYDVTLYIYKDFRMEHLCKYCAASLKQ
jgi:hypothetical protein